MVFSLSPSNVIMLNNFLRGNAHPEGFHPVISRGCIFSVCDYARENAWPSSCYTCLRCAQAFRREPATVCHRGGFACACARACFLWVPPPRALICPSFLPLGKKKRQIKNMRRKWSISVTEWYLEREDYRGVRGIRSILAFIHSGQEWLTQWGQES